MLLVNIGVIFYRCVSFGYSNWEIRVVDRSIHCNQPIYELSNLSYLYRLKNPTLLLSAIHSPTHIRLLVTYLGAVPRGS